MKMTTGGMRGVRKTSSSANLSITNLPLTELGQKPGFRYDRPAINNLSQGTSITGYKKASSLTPQRTHFSQTKTNRMIFG